MLLHFLTICKSHLHWHHRHLLVFLKSLHHDSGFSGGGGLGCGLVDNKGAIWWWDRQLLIFLSFWFSHFFSLDSCWGRLKHGFEIWVHKDAGIDEGVDRWGGGWRLWGVRFWEGRILHRVFSCESAIIRWFILEEKVKELLRALLTSLGKWDFGVYRGVGNCQTVHLMVLRWWFPVIMIIVFLCQCIIIIIVIFFLDYKLCVFRLV